jgi:hypothetical protein
MVLGLLLTSFGIGNASDSWVVRQDGVGPVKYGMSLAQLNDSLHEKFEMPRDEDERGCFYVEPKRHRGVAFMIEHGRATRVDVTAAGIRTAEGMEVGDTEKHALEVFGRRLKITPHAYTGPEGHYLTARSPDGKYGIRFETDGERITGYYAGFFKSIQYIEGCL